MDEATKQMINILVTQNDHFKGMMEFTVTSIITLLVIFLGINFFATRSIRKNELENISTNLEMEITKKLQIIIEQKIGHELEKSFKEFSKDMAILQTTIPSMNSQIELSNQFANKYYNYFNAKTNELEGKIWLINGVFSNALSSFLKAGKLYLDNDFTPNITPIVNRVTECLEKMRELSTFDRKDIESFLNRLSPEYKMTIERIYEILKDK